MHKKKRLGERVEEFYARFRASWWFVGIVLTWVGVWLFLHHIYGFDPHLDELNTQLSVEATVAGAIMSMAIGGAEIARRRAEKRHTEMLEYLTRVAERQAELSERQARILEYQSHQMTALLEATQGDER